jgi:hypothetical protein
LRISRPTPRNGLFYTFSAFHVPIFLSVHMPLGDTFKPAYSSDNERDTCNTAGSFIVTNFTRPHTRRARRQPHFCDSFVLTRTLGVSSVLLTAHSHHRHFVDPRRIICTQHLCRAFVNRLFNVVTANFRRLPRALGHFAYCAANARRSLRAGVSGRYTVIPPVGIPVL